jgi:hypothetical protein
VLCTAWQVAIISQASSSLWLGSFDFSALAFVPVKGAVFDFPRTDKCNVSVHDYDCSIGGMSSVSRGGSVGCNALWRPLAGRVTDMQQAARVAGHHGRQNCVCTSQAGILNVPHLAHPAHMSPACLTVLPACLLMFISADQVLQCGGHCLPWWWPLPGGI